MEREVCYAGIDVSKEFFDIGFYPLMESMQKTYDEKGLEEVIRILEKKKPTLIVLESTGGLEKRLVRRLLEANLPLAVVNPRRVRDFAKASGLLAKTDKIDARVLAQYGSVFKPAAQKLSTEAEEALKALMARRRQLIGMLVQEKNRLSNSAECLHEMLREHILWLEKQIQNLDRQLDEWIDQNPDWKEKSQIIRSMPGAGPVLTRTLMSELSELGRLNRKQIAMLAGVAPLNRDSGKWQGRRSVWGGRGAVRSALYMATITGIRCNPVIRSFYQRLIAAGKRPKVALTACMHKQLIILNTMLKTKTLWNQPSLAMA